MLVLVPVAGILPAVSSVIVTRSLPRRLLARGDSTVTGSVATLHGCPVIRAVTRGISVALPMSGEMK